jgi:hypothetical protein
MCYLSAMPDDARDMSSEETERAPEPSFAHHFVDPSIPDGENQAPANVYACPQCAQPVTIDREHGGPFVSCPHCGESFAIATAEDASEPHDLDDELSRAHDAELDGMRIRQLSVARRAAIRARTYLIIGVIVSLTGAEELSRHIVLSTLRKDASRLQRYLFAVTAVLAIYAARYLWIRFVEIGRELKRPLLEEPTEPADFSTLSDGSQRWKDLDDIR